MKNFNKSDTNHEHEHDTLFKENHKPENQKNGVSKFSKHHDLLSITITNEEASNSSEATSCSIVTTSAPISNAK